jgi:hypothetical protein
MKTKEKITQTVRQQDTVDALRSRNSRRKPSRVTEPTTEFGKSLQSLLGKRVQTSEVNEEELFAGAAYQLIKNRYGETVAGDFKSAFKLNLVDKPAGEKVSSDERAARETLKFFVNSTLLSKAEANDIRQLATAAAQLDANDALWDSIGDTRAVTSVERGTRAVQQRLEESGNAPVASTSAKASSVRAAVSNSSAKKGGSRGAKNATAQRSAENQTRMQHYGQNSTPADQIKKVKNALKGII